MFIMSKCWNIIYLMSINNILKFRIKYIKRKYRLDTEGYYLGSILMFEFFF